jgi:hypothetical protein
MNWALIFLLSAFGLIRAGRVSTDLPEDRTAAMALPGYFLFHHTIVTDP